MSLGYRGIAGLLALPFAAYAVAGAVQSYRAVVGIPMAKVESLPPADDFTKGRDRTQKASAGIQAIGHAAFAFAPEKIDANIPDDMDKLKRGTLERNIILDNLRIFLAGGKPGDYRGAMAKQFDSAGK